MNSFTHTLSIIIPCYNCAPVITRCIDSIDYNNAEIIIVNDGSTDNTTEIVEDYIALHKDKNIRIINKTNGGVSSARNIGIEHAQGKYICFIDADDYLSQGGLKRIIDIAEQNQADIVKYTQEYRYNNTEAKKTSVLDYDIHIELINGLGQALNRYDISDYHIWDALYRTSTIKDNSIRFCTDLHLREDNVFMGAFYAVASKVVITDLPLYNYYVESAYSHTHHQSIERQRILINSNLLAIKHRKEIIQHKIPDQHFPYEKYKYMSWVVMPWDAISAKLTLTEYKALLNEFQNVGAYPLKYRWIGIVHWYAPLTKKIKYAIKTFLCNHPLLAYIILRGQIS